MVTHTFNLNTGGRGRSISLSLKLHSELQDSRTIQILYPQNPKNKFFEKNLIPSSAIYFFSHMQNTNSQILSVIKIKYGNIWKTIFRMLICMSVLMVLIKMRVFLLSGYHNYRNKVYTLVNKTDAASHFVPQLLVTGRVVTKVKKSVILITYPGLHCAFSTDFMAFNAKPTVLNQELLLLFLWREPGPAGSTNRPTSAPNKNISRNNTRLNQ